MTDEQAACWSSAGFVLGGAVAEDHNAGAGGCYEEHGGRAGSAVLLLDSDYQAAVMGRTLLLQPGGRERRGTTRVLAKAFWQLCLRIGDA